MKTYFIFDFKRNINISAFPILDFGFSNYYKHYELSIEIGWLCFGIYFDWKINKRL